MSGKTQLRFLLYNRRRLVWAAFIASMLIVTLLLIFLKSRPPESHPTYWVVVADSKDWITRDHVFYTLKENGISTMAYKIGEQSVGYRVPMSQFDDAIKIMEKTAKDSRCIKILGPNRGNDLFWVDRGDGEEFNLEPRIAIDQIHELPKEYFVLLSAIRDNSPHSATNTKDSTVARLTGSKRQYLDSSGATLAGYDVVLTVNGPENTSFTEEYQIKNGKASVKLSKNDDGIVQNWNLLDIDQFWEILDQARQSNPVDDVELQRFLVKELRPLSKSELVQFERRYMQLMADAYRWDIKVAITLINGEIGEGVDFYYFRCSLVGRGRLIYEQVMADPETLLDHPRSKPFDHWPFSETYIFAAVDIAHRLNLGVAETDSRIKLDASIEWPSELGGNYIRIQNEEQVREKLPRLWKFANQRGFWQK